MIYNMVVKRQALTILDLADAISREDIETIRQCQENGLSLETPIVVDEWSTTRSPLSYAAILEKWNIVHALIDLGIQLEPLTGDIGRNALGLFIGHYESSLFERVLPLVDVNWQANDGNTPLHYALMHYQSPEGVYGGVIRTLLQNGADWTIENKYGTTAKQKMEEMMASHAEIKGLIEEEKARQESMQLNEETSQPVKAIGQRARF